MEQVSELVSNCLDKFSLKFMQNFYWRNNYAMRVNT